MAQLTEIQMIRFSKEDIQLLNRLRELKVKPHKFIRIALREKLQRDLSVLIKEEEKLKSKEYCPF